MAITAAPNAQLTIDKSPNYGYAAVGTNMDFILVVTNTGNVNLDNVTVFDQLDSNLKFIQGSVTVNGMAKPLESVISGINLGTLKPADTYTVVFTVGILSSPQGGIVYNTASAQYSYVPSPGAATLIGSANSDKVQLTVSNPSLKVVKSANVTNASLGDVITYNVGMLNNGDLEILNVQMVDKLPSGTSLVNGTFSINGKIVNNVDLSNVFVAHSIPVGGMVDIQYKLAVTSIDCGCNIDNTAIANYKYILPDGSQGIEQSTATPESTVSISMNISNFKQLSIEEYLEIPCQKPDIESMDNVMGTVDIIKCMIIPTNPLVSVEGQSLTNYKLIVHGVLRLVAEYTACDEEQSVHSAAYSVPFSSFIILPENFTPGTSMNVDAVVEDVYYNATNCRIFFTNTTLLIKACTASC